MQARGFEGFFAPGWLGGPKGKSEQLFLLMKGCLFFRRRDGRCTGREGAKVGSFPYVSAFWWSLILALGAVVPCHGAPTQGLHPGRARGSDVANFSEMAERGREARTG